MSNSKKHEGTSTQDKLRVSKRQAGFDKDRPSKKDRELDEPNDPDNHNDLDSTKKSKNDIPKDRELDEETDAKKTKKN
ncbi:hypothetical protein [Rasiella sp. SM2506]|uniref:hypothetical protein n=1 Tax=Rasiella sp. SM2506 TaxID=3423914 RepID=UPI003D7B2112